jgi:hypothetical protein
VLARQALTAAVLSCAVVVACGAQNNDSPQPALDSGCGDGCVAEAGCGDGGCADSGSATPPCAECDAGALTCTRGGEAGSEASAFPLTEFTATSCSGVRDLGFETLTVRCDTKELCTKSGCDPYVFDGKSLSAGNLECDLTSYPK